MAERNDVLRSQDVIRRASSVQRGTSGRSGTSRTKCAPTVGRFQPGPRTRKAGTSQQPSRSSTCPRPRKTEKRDDEKEQLRLDRPIAPVPFTDPLAGPTQAVGDGCDDAGFFITCLEGADTMSKSTCPGSVEADAGFFCPPTRSSSSTAQASAPSVSESIPSGWTYTPAQDKMMSVLSLEQRSPPAAPAQSEWSQWTVAEQIPPPPQPPLEAPARLPPRAPTGLLEQAALPSAHCSGPSSCASSRPQARQARIRQLLQNVHEATLIEVPPCPMEAARVDARQQQAYERHMRLRSRSPGGSRGDQSSSASSFRRSRSLMDLVSGGPTLLELSMADPPGWRPRQGYECPDPVPAELLESLLDRLPTVAAMPGQTEPCTICLDVPEPGEMVTTLACCHWYHRECIREWLSHSRLCPLCKASAVPRDDG